MEAAKVLGTPPPDMKPGSDGRLTVIPSQGEKGFFYPEYELPSYEGAVDKANILSRGEPVHHRGYGTVYLEEWPMDDEAGTRYHVARCIADNPISGAWAVKDTAWSTQVE